MVATYAGELDDALSPPRVVARANDVWFRALAAVSPNRHLMGAKLFGLGRGRSVTYLVALFDQESGELRVLMDAKYLTAVRTAAASAAGSGEANTSCAGNVPSVATDSRLDWQSAGEADHRV